MLNKNNFITIPISIGFLTAANLIAAPIGLAGAGIGADIYCVMREGGNEHEASWRAAYESIKNQKPGIFKTSPKQAAAMIIEAVVREPEKFDGCINYLGDLYPRPGELDAAIEDANYPSKDNYTKDRYNY